MKNLNVEELYESGYRSGRPYWGLIDGASIDEEVCADAVCEKCAHQGLEYHPFIKDEPRSYRAFYKCPECGHADEF